VRRLAYLFPAFPVLHQTFTLGEVLGPLAAEFQAMAADRGMHLSVVDSAAWVRSDPLLLRRVLQNFLSNALRYSERGRVLLGLRRHGACVRLEVWDTGPGIAPEERERIFQAFHRLNHAGGQGLGLGLSIAQRMAALLDHPLGLRSWPGRGSVFHLDVPRAQPVSAPPAAAEIAHGVAAGRAVVLDNEPAARTALATVLQGWGWQVHVAAQPRQALETPWRPDLYVLDYHLDHGVTGLDVLRAVRRAHPGVQVLILTADRDGELRQRILDAGAMVLYKPLKPLALQQVLQRLATAMA